VNDRDLSKLSPSALKPGESVIWSGGPDPTTVFAPQDGILVPGSVVFLLVAVAVFAGGIAGSAALAFLVPVGVIVILALYAAFGRFFYKRFDRRRTAYLVTDRRAIVIRGRSPEVRSVPISTPPNRTERRVDGKHGTLRWGGPASAENIGDLLSNFRGSGWLAGTYWPGGSDSAQMSFWDVEDFDALLAARTRSRSHEGKSE
jgi:hypothetical protein